MSEHTYLITIDVPDDRESSEAFGLEIEDTLTDNGFDVIGLTSSPAPEPPPPTLF
jgi:hypothetical protein